MESDDPRRRGSSPDSSGPRRSPPTLDQRYDLQQSPEMHPVFISRRARRHNEWAEPPEAQSFIIEDRKFLLADPKGFHTRLLVGPSDIGKTTIATHIARVNEADNNFMRQLQEATGNKNQRYLALHLSLSHAMNEISRRTGIKKHLLGEEHRQQASALMLDTIRVAQQIFSERDDLTVELFVDTVGVTESDLGTSVVEALVHEQNVRVFAVDLNQDVEEKGRKTRQYVVEHAHDPNLDSSLKKRGQYHGRKFAGRAEELIASAGNEDMWRRHWTDIYEQAINKYPDIASMHLYAGQTLEEFLGDFALRNRVYHDVVEHRFRQLGFTVFPPTITSPEAVVTWVNNDKPLKKVHTHFDRVYGNDEQEGKEHQLPLELITGDKPAATYTYQDITFYMKQAT